MFIKEASRVINFFMENFIKKYNVSRETLASLQRYVSLLEEWQNMFNLVSKNSLPDVWQRHIADSAELFQYIDKKAGLVYDFGSGAGFPAIVLAIMAAKEKPKLRFLLIESTTKKTVFLNAVKEALVLKNVYVINDRIENLKLQKADFITSRALAALPQLLEYALPYTELERTKLIFPKGRKYRGEVEEARKQWSFTTNVYRNTSSNDGVILVLEDLRRK